MSNTVLTITQIITKSMVPCGKKRTANKHTQKYIRKILLCKSNIRVSNKHNNIIPCLLLHVLAELHHFYGVCQSMLELNGVWYYNSNMYYIIVVSAADLKNIRSQKMWLQFYMFPIWLGFTTAYKNILSYSWSVMDLVPSLCDCPLLSDNWHFWINLHALPTSFCCLACKRFHR
jgi:hypothetical protein